MRRVQLAMIRKRAKADRLELQVYRLKLKVQAVQAEIVRLRSEAPISVPESLRDQLPHLREFEQAEPFPCVYFLIDADRVVYVGQTTNLTQRLLHHSQRKHFDRVLFLPVSNPLQLVERETHFIRVLKPKLNKAGLT